MGTQKMALRASVARRGVFTPVLDVAANMYARMLGTQLKKYGLRFEDIHVETPQVQEAVRRLPPQEQEERSMRIRRAADLSFKKTYLPESMQAQHEPFKVYMMPTLKQVEQEVWEQKQFDRE